jgi:hypothetical protein
MSPSGSDYLMIGIKLSPQAIELPQSQQDLTEPDHSLTKTNCILLVPCPKFFSYTALKLLSVLPKQTFEHSFPV